MQHRREGERRRRAANLERERARERARYWKDPFGEVYLRYRRRLRARIAQGPECIAQAEADLAAVMAGAVDAARADREGNGG